MAHGKGESVGTMPGVLILGGFLGSGKTTLLLQLAQQAGLQSESDVPIAIIENEIGEVGIDDDSVGGAGYEVTSIVSGCACCTLKAELTGAIRQIAADLSPELIIVEATGVAVPADMADNIVEYAGADVRVCTLVDASRWRRIHVALQQILDQQLSGADVVCVNKCDLVDDAELAFIDETLEEFSPTADILHVSAQSPLSADDAARILGAPGGSAGSADRAGVQGRAADGEHGGGGGGHHHHHHHGEADELEPVTLKGELVSGEVRARVHEGASVASAVLYLQEPGVVTFDTFVNAMSAIAADVEAAGGVIGHIKSSADDGKSRVKASIVAAGEQPDVEGDASVPLGKRHVVKLVAIVMGIEAARLQAALVSAIQA